MVDGKAIQSEITGNINVIIDGDVETIDCGGSVTVNGNVTGLIDCGGSAKIKANVTGDIDCEGSCTCRNVNGNINAGGSVLCDI